ncbi:MAG: hypothetical protein AAF959_25780 [Cyanobacteria bacterium P01_D01_bin.56]
MNAIHVLAEIARTSGHQAHYKVAYDNLWQALLLADQANLEYAKACIYTSIGRYYSFYKRKENALGYFDQALSINQKLIEDGKHPEAILSDVYFAISKTYGEFGEIGLSKQYLDSCINYHDPNVSGVHQAYLSIEQANLLSSEDRLVAALEHYNQALPWLRENDPGHQTLVHTFIADIKRRQGHFDESEALYNEALQISATYNRHIDFTPLIYEKLSKLYYDQGRFDAAYQNLWTTKELDEMYFDSRSENNRPLLEILDAFRRQKDQQQQLIQQNRVEELEHEERVFFLQRSILLVCLGSLLLLGFLYFKYVQNKHRTEKKLIKKEQELEIQKTKEILEMRNKELSISTLKLIEKDEFFSVLKEKLSKRDRDINIQEVKRLVRNKLPANGPNWEEFEARFVAVNQGFYDRLKERHPKLTQGDLKLCALIKLNFSSKDLARLLGISVESVHTTRYRLRKKLGLTRDVNLVEFIADV